MDFEDPSTVGTPADARASPEVEFHEASGAYRAEFDGHSRSASVAVVDAVTAACEGDPLDLPPLYSAVDTDALDALFDSTTGGRHGRRGTLSFEFAGRRVTVNGHGTVHVEPASAHDG